MQCLYCGKPLGLLKGLTDGEFCSRDHRQRYRSLTQRALVRLQESRLAMPKDVVGQAIGASWKSALQVPPHAGFVPQTAVRVELAAIAPKPAPGRSASAASFQTALVAPEFPRRAPRLKPSMAPPARLTALGGAVPPVGVPVAAPELPFPGCSPLAGLAFIRLETADPPLWTLTEQPGDYFVTEPAALFVTPRDFAPSRARGNGTVIESWRLRPVLAKMDAGDHMFGLAAAPRSDLALRVPAQPGKTATNAPPFAPAERTLAPRIARDAQALCPPGPAGTPQEGKPLVPGHSLAAATSLSPRPASLPAHPAAAFAEVGFAPQTVRRPVLAFAGSRLELRATSAVHEEVLGANAAASPMTASHLHALGSGNVLPALASLFRCSRPAAPAATMPHVVEGMVPQNRRATPAAFMELPMAAERPTVPASSGLRIVETFEYLRPLEQEPFDAWASLVQLWRRAPVFVRFATAAACLILLLWSVAPGPGLLDVVASRMGSVREGIGKRAAVELSEDFQGGMADWSGSGNWAETWRLSKAGYVKPGRLALYQPSMNMREYNVEFLMQIEEKALGFAYRAVDPQNYYAAKIVVQKSGPLPELSLVRYPVLGGRPGSRVEVPIRLVAHSNTPYRVRLSVSGNGYSTSIEGQLVDFWTDDKLTTGGFGLFTDAGESARVYWMKLSHQTDIIGRMCAYFYTADVDRRNTRKRQ